jgi:hypothetical protein
MKGQQPGDEEENEEAFMKNVQVLVIASLGVALAAACGGSSTTGSTDGGSGSSTGSGSGSFGTSGSGSGSVGTSGSGSTGASTGAGSGNADAGPLTASNDCPNCPGSQVCCLSNAGGQVQGTCAATPAACPTGAGAIECAAEMDCNTGETCCVTGGSANSPASSACVTSCPTGKPACGGAPRDNMDCPGGAAGWVCQVVPGTPDAVLGVCVPAEGGAPAEGGGTPEGGDAAPAVDAPNG